MNEDVLVQYAPCTHKIIRAKKIIKETINYYVIIINNNYRYINKRTLNEKENEYSKWYKMSKKELQEIIKHTKLVETIKHTDWESVNIKILQNILKILEK